MPSKSNTEAFIAKANLKHGGRYTYEKTVYGRQTNRVVITCPLHGPFEQSAKSHLAGAGCRKCAEEARRLTKASFIEKAQALFGGKYRYDKVLLKDRFTKVTITCPIHGEFEKTPKKHLAGAGCQKCAWGGYTTEGFITKAREIHGTRFGYGMVDIKGIETPITIICPVHGPFEQWPKHHLAGNGCAACGEDAKIQGDSASVYLVKLNDDNYKIGMSGNLNNRLADIRTELYRQPRGLTLIHIGTPGWAYIVEQKLLKSYKEKPTDFIPISSRPMGLNEIRTIRGSEEHIIADFTVRVDEINEKARAEASSCLKKYMSDGVWVDRKLDLYPPPCILYEEID